MGRRGFPKYKARVFGILVLRLYGCGSLWRMLLHCVCMRFPTSWKQNQKKNVRSPWPLWLGVWNPGESKQIYMTSFFWDPPNSNPCIGCTELPGAILHLSKILEIVLSWSWRRVRESRASHRWYSNGALDCPRTSQRNRRAPTWIVSEDGLFSHISAWTRRVQ